MATKSKEKKKEKKLLEDPDVVAEQLEYAEDFLKNNQKWILIVLGVVLLGVAGVFMFSYYRNTQSEQAQNDMVRATKFFEADSLDKALKSDGNIIGFPEIAEDYAITKQGNLAHFYAGAAYLKKGKFQDAIDHLKDFSSSDVLVQARAYSLIGDSYMELKNYSDAASYYSKAAAYKSNKFFSPQYLMKEALAYEKQGDNEAAIKAYDQIIEDYSDASEYNDARKGKARLEAIISK